MQENSTTTALQREADSLLRSRRKSGSKRNRKREHMQLTYPFLRFVAKEHGLTRIKHITKKHIIAFYKANQALSPKQLYNYYLRIRDLITAADMDHRIEVPIPNKWVNRPQKAKPD